MKKWYYHKTLRLSLPKFCFYFLTKNNLKMKRLLSVALLTTVFALTVNTKVEAQTAMPAGPGTAVINFNAAGVNHRIGIVWGFIMRCAEYMHAKEERWSDQEKRFVVLYEESPAGFYYLPAEGYFTDDQGHVIDSPLLRNVRYAY